MADTFKVLLINPPLNNFDENPYPPLGLGYIAAVIEKAGFQVDILDMPINGNNINDLEILLQRINPDIVGISCIAANYKETMAIARIVKNCSDSMVVVGGPHATFIPQYILKRHKYVDVVVRGEGEKTIGEIIQKRINKRNINTILGITFRDDNARIISNSDRPPIKNIDNLPLPARHLLPMKRYQQKTKFTSLIGSRGCMFNCIYCSSSTFWCHKVRFRKTNHIIDEIVHIRNNYRYDHFKFVDDVPIFYKREVDFFNKIKDLNIKWDCNVRVDMVDDRTLKQAAESGCIKVTYGIESSSEEILRTIKKNTTPNQIKNAIKLAKQYGIEVKLNFIFGLPGDTKETLIKSLKLIETLNPSAVMIHPLTPYPGTEITKNANNYGITFTEQYWWEKGLNNSPVFNKNLTYKEILDYISQGHDILNNLGIEKNDGY